MKKINKKSSIELFAVIAIIAALIVIFYAKEESAPFRRSGQETISPARISLIAESPPVKIDFDAGDTLFAVLQKAKTQNIISFSGYEYPLLGFFVIEIGPLRSGNGKYLIYYINNKEASVGVSSYLPKNGDVIEWKLK